MMKSIMLFIQLLFVCICVNAQVWQPSSGYTQIPIWPHGKMPDAIPVTKPESATISDAWFRLESLKAIRSPGL